MTRRRLLACQALLILVGVLFLPEREALAHAGRSTPAMWEVCEHATLGDGCRFVGPHGELHIGTCRRLGGHQACVRNQPLQPMSKSGRASGPGFTLAGWNVAGLVALAGAALAASRSRERRA